MYNLSSQILRASDSIVLNISEGAETIYFLTGIQHILRELPFKVFTDDATRTAVLDAAQTALDTAIEKEEAASPLISTGEQS